LNTSVSRKVGHCLNKKGVDFTPWRRDRNHLHLRWLRVQESVWSSTSP